MLIFSISNHIPLPFVLLGLLAVGYIVNQLVMFFDDDKDEKKKGLNAYQIAMLLVGFVLSLFLIPFEVVTVAFFLCLLLF
mgnify:CR=1 FL=1